jgi:hypothetical protein
MHGAMLQDVARLGLADLVAAVRRTASPRTRTSRWTPCAGALVTHVAR